MTEQTNKPEVYPPGSRLLLNCGTEHVPCLYEATISEWSAKGHVRLRLADGKLSWYAKLDTVIEALPQRSAPISRSEFAAMARAAATFTTRPENVDGGYGQGGRQ